VASGPILRSNNSKTRPSSVTIPGKIAIGKFGPIVITVRRNTGRREQACNPALTSEPLWCGAPSLTGEQGAVQRSLLCALFFQATTRKCSSAPRRGAYRFLIAR
jgi:hypothetical protein